MKAVKNLKIKSEKISTLEIKDGALSDNQIKSLKLNTYFNPAISLEHISPASLDLVTQEERYRISRMTLPKKGERVRDIFARMDATKIKQSSREYVLERGVKHIVYIGKITKPLPSGVRAHVSPKSSTGRVDVHVKLLADGVAFYDTLPEGFIGDLWMLVIAQSFPVILPSGESLSQIRFVKGEASTDEDTFHNLIKNGLVKDRKFKKIKYGNLEINSLRKSFIMTLDLDIKNPGFVCRGTDKILDLSKRFYYDTTDFFEPVNVKSGGLILEPHAFYILSTKEVLDIPGNIAGEMEVSNYKLGEFRAHYAGFFDPGFKGFGTLEVRSSEILFVYDGYPITEMVFETLSGETDVLYGDKKNVNYQGQVGPTLAKYFKK